MPFLILVIWWWFSNLSSAQILIFKDFRKRQAKKVSRKTTKFSLKKIDFRNFESQALIGLMGNKNGGLLKNIKQFKRKGGGEETVLQLITIPVFSFSPFCFCFSGFGNHPSVYSTFLSEFLSEFLFLNEFLAEFAKCSWQFGPAFLMSRIVLLWYTWYVTCAMCYDIYHNSTILSARNT